MCYQPLILTHKSIDILFVMELYLDNARIMLKSELLTGRNAKHTVEYWRTVTNNKRSPSILLQTEPFIVSTNLSMTALIHKAFQRKLHGIPITVEMIFL